MTLHSRFVNVFVLLRILIGLYFASAGIAKLSRPFEEFQFVIQSYAILPPAAEEWLARCLPWAEALAGSFLIVGLWTRQALAAIWLMTTCFILALASLLYRQINLEDCGCLALGVPISPRATLLLDAAIWVTVAACWRRMDRLKILSVDQAFARAGAGGRP